MIKTNFCPFCDSPVTSRHGVKRYCGSQTEKGSCAHKAKLSRINMSNKNRKHQSYKAHDKSRIYSDVSDWLDYS